MIQENELRVGNLIKSKLLSTYHRVTGFICMDNRRFLYTDLQIPYAAPIRWDFELIEWEGVELTPEILEKAGFGESEYIEFTCSLNGKKDIGENKQIVYYHNDFWCGAWKARNIKYVHQLQNLFHAVTGNELEIKL